MESYLVSLKKDTVHFQNFMSLHLSRHSRGGGKPGRRGALFLFSSILLMSVNNF